VPPTRAYGGTVSRDPSNAAGPARVGPAGSETEGRLPTFLIIGAMKGGTTSLHHYLRQHPDVYMPERKELKFFVDRYAGDAPVKFLGPCNWGLGLEWYRQWFRDAEDARAVGEASPNYTKWPDYPDVPERIAATIPDARLIYIVRHPIDRMRSHYLHDVAKGRQPLPIDRALLEDTRYLHASRYATQIQRYLEWFDADQLLVITSDDLRHHRERTVARALRFIGVDDSLMPENLDVEAWVTGSRRVQTGVTWRVRRLGIVPHLPAAVRAAGKRALTRRAPDAVEPSPEVRARLADALSDEVTRLRPYLGPGFDGWGIG